MTFDDRQKVATKLVVEFLEGCAPPRGMSEEHLAKRVTQIADAFARKMPVGKRHDESVQRVLTRVRDTHLSNKWPPQAAFVTVMLDREQREGAQLASDQVKNQVALCDRWSGQAYDCSANLRRAMQHEAGRRSR